MKAHGLNPRIRKSPYFASSLKCGATEFHPYNGMWMPVVHDTPVNEYWNTIERATMWDAAPRLPDRHCSILNRPRNSASPAGVPISTISPSSGRIVSGPGLVVVLSR